MNLCGNTEDTRKLNEPGVLYTPDFSGKDFKIVQQTETTNTDLDWIYELIEEIRV